MPASDTSMPDVEGSASEQPVAPAVTSDVDDGHPAGPINDGYNVRAARIRVLPGDSDTAASFEFMHEDHTLGNALRHVIMKNPDVEFCGYSIPHPSDPKMNLRIQTYDEVSVYDVLEKGLSDLMDVCDVVLEKFEEAVEANPKTEEV